MTGTRGEKYITLRKNWHNKKDFAFGNIYINQDDVEKKLPFPEKFPDVLFKKKQEDCLYEIHFRGCFVGIYNTSPNPAYLERSYADLCGNKVIYGSMLIVADVLINDSEVLLKSDKMIET